MSKNIIGSNQIDEIKQFNNLNLIDDCKKSNVKDAIDKLKKCDNIEVFSGKIEGNNNENYHEVLWLTGC